MGAIVFFFICIVMVLDIANNVDKKYNQRRK